MNRRTYLFLGVAVLLAANAVAMLFTDEVQWSAFDFAVAALLLGGAALAVDWVWTKIKGRRSRIIGAVAVLLVLALIWGELAVGLFGSPWAGN
jgi:hypothetical protein